MKSLLILLPTLFCLVGCSEIGEEEFGPANITAKQAPASFDETFSSPAIGRLSLSYLASDGNGKNVWLLLLERKIPWKDRPAGTRFEGYVGSDGPVTLLIVEPNRSAGKNGWGLINTIPLSIVRGHKKYLSMRWLEPANQKGPVLLVNKLEGVGGSQELIAFPNGWSQANPVRQVYGSWMGRDEGSTYAFYSVDRKGFMCIAETHSTFTTNSSDTGPSYFEFKTMKYHLWNGNGWKP